MTRFRTPGRGGREAGGGENGNPRASEEGRGRGRGGSVGGARHYGRYSQCQGSEGTVRVKPKRLALAASHL